jgi:nucleotide-binding universal stress UspA family protein
MERMKKERIIIWALDPFHGKKQDHVKAALYVENLARNLKAKVEPTFILSPNVFYLPMDYFMPPEKSEFINVAQAELDELLRNFNSKNFLPGRVLYDEAFTLRGTVSTFISYAQDRKALLIFSPTHARKGLPRFWLGSFAETLLMYSPIPVVTVNPRVRGPLRFHTVIYPTDLSEPSQKSLSAFLPVAKLMNAKVHLLHGLQGYTTTAALASEGLSDVAYNYYAKEMKRIRRTREKQIQAWARLCKRHGVPATSEVAEDANEVLQTVLKTAKRKHANMIAMATTSGPLENVMTGGITRQVVRYADVPVWVMHQSSKGKRRA